MKMPFKIIIIFLILFVGCSKKQIRSIFGKVVLIKGSIEVYNPEKSKWNVLDRLTDVFFGDSIRTFENSELEIIFEDDNIIKLAESTIVYLQETFDSSGQRVITISNACGKVLSELKSIKEKDIRYIVQTPTAYTDAKGTHFIVFFAPVPFVTHVTVLHGKVKVFNPFEPLVPVVVIPGFHTVVWHRKVPIAPIPLNYGQFKKLHRILGPKAYSHYSVKFKIKPDKMKHFTPIFPHHGPVKIHPKGPGHFKGKVKLGSGSGISIKGKSKPKKVFKAKFKGKKLKGKVKRK